MPVFRIPVEWKMRKAWYVKADTIQEAIGKVREGIVESDAEMSTHPDPDEEVVEPACIVYNDIVESNSGVDWHLFNPVDWSSLTKSIE